MKNRLLPAVLLVLLAGGGALWFFLTFERTEEERYVGMSGAARTNRLLAFERFVVAMGRETRTVKSIVELDALPAGATLVVGRNRESLGAPGVARIAAWVKAGGFLVLEAEREKAADPLADELGIDREAAKPRPGPPTATTITLPTSAGPIAVELPTSVTLDAGDASSDDDGASPDGKGKSDERTAFRLGDESGTRVLGLHRGGGRVVVLADFGPLVNSRLGKAQNATFAWSIVQWGDTPDRARGPILVLTRPGKLSIVAWLLDNAFLVIVAAGVLGLLLLARALPRFGPVMPDPLPARRRIGDHLAAAGRFLWRHDELAPLVAATRKHAVDGMERLAPGFAIMSPGEQVAKLAAATGCTTDEARVLLASRATEAQHLTATARLAQRVHATLAHRATARAGAGRPAGGAKHRTEGAADRTIDRTTNQTTTRTPRPPR